jgi:hypothetical protein
MVKAQDLINKQKEREKNKYKTFAKIYQNIEKKITMASAANHYYIWCEIPEFVIGLPLYKFKECMSAIVKQLNDNGFKTEEYEPNILLISWFP